MESITSNENVDLMSIMTYSANKYKFKS